jgi:internalin A
LRISNQKISQLHLIAGLKTLIFLDINNIQPLPLNLDFLSELPHLQALWVSTNALKTQDLAPLQGLLALRQLDISENQIDDLSFCANLPNLVTLFCNNNQIKTLAPLTACKNLRRVICWDNPLKKSERKLLEKALPDCGVEL